MAGVDMWSVDFSLGEYFILRIIKIEIQESGYYKLTQTTEVNL